MYRICFNGANYNHKEAFNKRQTDKHTDKQEGIQADRHRYTKT